MRKTWVGSQPEDTEGVPGGPWGCLEEDTPDQRAVEGTHPGARQCCKAGGGLPFREASI